MTCEDGATAEWNLDSWGIINIISNGAKKIKCNIDFKEEQTLIEYLKNLQSNELVEDDYGNLRYIGKNPNNYVKFNNELWRIIGVMKDIENADGSKEDKVKLIRSQNIGNYTWDNKNYDGDNDWSTSTLQKMLNEGVYYNRTSGNCPFGQSGATKACDFSSIGLTEDAKSMISESIWNLGGNTTSSSAKESYQLERGTKVYTGRPIKWIGKVGLMYPSDYGYATNGGSIADRETCLTENLFKWGNSLWENIINLNDCYQNDWLYKGSEWTLMPESGNPYGAFKIGRYSDIQHTYVTSIDVTPTIYLNSKLEITSKNNGSSTSPFILK